MFVKKVMSASVRNYSTKTLTVETLNPNVLKTEYAVRGEVAVRATKYQQMLDKGEKLPFEEILFCNIGNPQQLQQKPITFFRNVLSVVTSPELVNHEKELSGLFKPDVFRRARNIIESGFDKGSSSGAYTHSQGLAMVRDHVSRFIEKRDGVPLGTIDPTTIFLTDGASPAVQLMLKSIIRDGNDGIMIPIPQYPLYSASIQLFGGSQVPYMLEEEQGWGLTVESLERAYEQGVQQGLNVRALVIINPGNPTGQVMERANIAEIIEFCERRKVLLLADEVYQTNIYTQKKEFHSFNRVAHEMGKMDTLEMVSFHSVSKGFLGECGRRGGYMHVSSAVDPAVRDQLYKLASVNLCPNVDGQLMVDLMVNPPQQGDESYEQYVAERDAILQSLGRRAKLVAEALNGLEGVSCQECEGAMYAFPQITLPPRAIEEAQKRGVAPDQLYVLELLDQTGVVCVAGSGFQQKPGTFHFRTTFLPREDKIKLFCEKIRDFHVAFMKKYSQ